MPASRAKPVVRLVFNLEESSEDPDKAIIAVTAELLYWVKRRLNEFYEMKNVSPFLAAASFEDAAASFYDASEELYTAIMPDATGELIYKLDLDANLDNVDACELADCILTVHWSKSGEPTLSWSCVTVDDERRGRTVPITWSALRSHAPG